MRLATSLAWLMSGTTNRHVYGFPLKKMEESFALYFFNTFGENFLSSSACYKNDSVLKMNSPK